LKSKNQFYLTFFLINQIYLTRNAFFFVVVERNMKCFEIKELFVYRIDDKAQNEGNLFRVINIFEGNVK